MITKKAMEHAQISGAQAVLSHYGLEKLSGAPMGMLSTLGKGFQNAATRFGKAKGIGAGVQEAWKGMGAPAQNIVKGIGAGAGAMYLGNQVMNQNQQRRGPYGY
jgi:hypothetical protein